MSAGGWADAGFEVQQQWTTGNDYTCNGEAGEEICVRYKIAHTEYEVIGTYENGCSGRKNDWGEAYKITAPNKANRGGKEHCVRETCRAQGDQYWEKGPAGVAKD